jgi:alkylation response protein AidB-like acyl-CoA dehydrogenase
VEGESFVDFDLTEDQRRIQDMARTLTYKAAWLVDQRRADPALNAMAKYYAAETAVWVCDKALQMHGGCSEWLITGFPVKTLRFFDCD